MSGNSQLLMQKLIPNPRSGWGILPSFTGGILAQLCWKAFKFVIPTCQPLILLDFLPKTPQHSNDYLKQRKNGKELEVKAEGVRGKLQ